MYSINGIITYLLEWTFIFLYTILSPATFFIPIDIIIAMFEYKWDGMEKWFYWYFPWAFGLNTLYGVYSD